MGKPDPGEILIRTTIKPGDLGYIIYLHGKIYHEEFGFSSDFESYVAGGLAEFYKHYDPLLDGVWILEHHDKIVGSLVLMHRELRQAPLRYFIIDPRYRGSGLGKKLSDLFLAHLVEKKFESAYLWTTHELHAAAKIYQNMGFRLTGELPSGSFGKQLTEQRYDLVLRPKKSGTKQVNL